MTQNRCDKTSIVISFTEYCSIYLLQKHGFKSVINQMGLCEIKHCLSIALRFKEEHSCC